MEEGRGKEGRGRRPEGTKERGTWEGSLPSDTPQQRPKDPKDMKKTLIRIKSS